MYKSKIFKALAKFLDSIKGNNKTKNNKKHRTAKDAKNRLRKDIDANRIKYN